MNPRIPLHWWLLCSVAWISALGLGCSSKEIRYPEDHERITRIDDAVEQFRTAYVGKDYARIQQFLLPVEHLDRLGQEIQADFSTFDTISLDFAIERIQIDGENSDVFVRWQGLWRRSPDDLGLRDRGHGILKCVGVNAILLRDTQGDLPFGIANRAPLPGSGPSTAPPTIMDFN